MALLVALSCHVAAAAGSAPLSCAQTLVPSPAAPSVAQPCWAEITPYPFGQTGEAADPTAPQCARLGGDVNPACYLTVSSIAFRAPNRGLAAMLDDTPFGVWLYNGSRWFPDPTFPGKRVCPGTTVFWAGKLDYWLVGGPWTRVCRFDGAEFAWEPLTLPATTLQRVTKADGTFLSGGITAGACLSWDDCTLFGSYGVRVHWNGFALTDRSAPISRDWQDAGMLAAALLRGPDGSPFGLAVAASGHFANDGGPVASGPDGSPPAQVFSLAAGGDWRPLPVDVPSLAGVPGPRTDLVGVALAADGRGWAAGNGPNAIGPVREPFDQREPAPLLSIAPDGSDGGCAAPRTDTFGWTTQDLVHVTDDVRFTSVAASADGVALAGADAQLAQAAPTGERNTDVQDEPYLLRVHCGGRFEATAFRIPDPTYVPPRRCRPAPCVAPLVPANRGGAITAVAAPAPNVGWAAASRGGLLDQFGTVITEPPRLYRFTDGQPPSAAAGDDRETRPVELGTDDTADVPDPPTAPPDPAPSPRNVQLPPDVYWITVKLQGTRLRVMFSLRRKLKIRVDAIKGKSQVSTTRLHTLNSGRHSLYLKLERKRWPTRLRLLEREP
jgi:hypothetical protein